MPKIDFEAIELSPAGPAEYNAALGNVYRGENVEIARAGYPIGGGPKFHSHPEEQIVYVLKGRIRVWSGDDTFEVTAGQAYHNFPNARHGIEVLEDLEFLSFKNGYSTKD